jgi:hypothetical protein
LRLVASVEALNGLLLLSWSGAFLFGVLDRDQRLRHDRSPATARGLRRPRERRDSPARYTCNRFPQKVKCRGDRPAGSCRERAIERSRDPARGIISTLHCSTWGRT